MDALAPYRGAFGAPRPARLAALALPPASMPSHLRGRPLKSWRYVAVFTEELMLCAAVVRIGPARQRFWALWDREREVLLGRTVLRPSRAVVLAPGRLRVADHGVSIDLELEETAGIETVCPHGHHYAWTRKQGDVSARGSVRVGGPARELEARAIVDDSAGYHARHTAWRWSAGVGLATDGRRVAWNLVEGMNDPPQQSERSVWVDGVASEAPPVSFSPDLRRVGDLEFTPEAERSREDNLLVLRSSYRQPFGTFAGSLPGGLELAEGLGVMERHDVAW
jgi:hypothetical protein